MFSSSSRYIRRLFCHPRSINLLPEIENLRYSQTFMVLRNRLVIQKLDAGQGIEVEWDNGEKNRFHSSWLRMNCHCSKCGQEHSGQRQIDCSELPEHISLQDINVSGNSSEVTVSWSHERDHTSVYKLDWLKKHSYSKKDIEKRSLQRKPERFQGKIPPSVDYEEIVNTDSGLLEWLQQINLHGISVVKGVPCEDTNMRKAVQRIGPVLDNIYGELFDVISTPQPINIAYSSAKLPLHMDLVYYQSPPGIQFLHCLRFDPQVVGGLSTFTDAFAVAERLREEYPEEFETLCRVPATFQKIHFERESPVSLTYQRPHIALNHRKEIVAVTWAPPFEGPLFVQEDDVEPYFKAYRQFHKEIEESPLKLKFGVKEGDLVSFNNIRMVHGREEFELNGGVRHLKGCYINIDEFSNKLNVMSHLKGDRRLPKRLGNNCFF